LPKVALWLKVVEARDRTFVELRDEWLQTIG
jgi:hypothetical protein